MFVTEYNRHSYINSKLEIEPELVALFKKNKVKTVFDIGACECEDSVRYARLFTNATIYAFEPREDNFQTAKQTLLKYSANTVKLEKLALSKEAGTFDFYPSEGAPEGESEQSWNFGNKSSSLLPPTEELKNHISWLKFGEPVKVSATTLELYSTQNNIDEIDFIHIDVQGAEMLVLEGAGKMLSKVKLIWMEVEKIPLYHEQALQSEIETYMRQHGFVNLYDTVGSVSGDQLYANKNYFSGNKLFRVRVMRQIMILPKKTKKIVTHIKDYFKNQFHVWPK